MRKIILAISIFLSLIWGDIKGVKVLETSDIKEYNKWVLNNKATANQLPLFLIDIKCLAWNSSWSINYYNKNNGELSSQEILNSKLGEKITLKNFPINEKFIIYSFDTVQAKKEQITISIKNSLGKEINSITTALNSIYNPDIGFFIPELNKNIVTILDDFGEKIGIIEKIDGFELSDLIVNNNMILLSVRIPQKYIILLDHGKEVWRKNFSSAVNYAISNDGQYVCIGDSGFIYIYNQKGKLLYKECLSSTTITNPHISFSKNGEYLAAATSKKLMLIDIRAKKKIWEENVDGDSYVRHLFFSDNNKIILTHTSAAKIYIYDLQGILQNTIHAPCLYCSVINNYIIIDNNKDIFYKTIYKISD